MRAPLRYLFIWLGMVVSAWPIGAAHAQAAVTCGNLHFRATPQTGHASKDWFSYQVFLRASGDERPLLPNPWGGEPRATCVGGLVLAIAHFAVNGDPYVRVVFQNGGNAISLLSEDEYTVQGHAIVLPARPRLPDEIREHIPAEYRDLFDYGPLKGKFG